MFDLGGANARLCGVRFKTTSLKFTTNQPSKQNLKKSAVLARPDKAIVM